MIQSGIPFFEREKSRAFDVVVSDYESQDDGYLPTVRSEPTIINSLKRKQNYTKTSSAVSLKSPPQSIASSPSSSSSSDEEDGLPTAYDPAQVTILVVDDDSVARKVLQSLLTKFGFQVVVVVDGTVALRELENNPLRYNLIITDVMMPMISGFTLVQTIRQNEALKDVPIIMMSGSMLDNKSANDSIRIGSQDYLTKPIAKDLLKQKVDILLQNAFQKKRAAEYRTVLLREREKGSLLAKQMEAKEHEIEELKKRVSDMTSGKSDALETPVQTIARNIESLLGQHDWASNPASIRDELHTILRELTSQSLYRPHFEKVLKDSEVDVVTKSFLVGQFTPTDADNNGTATDSGAGPKVNTNAQPQPQGREPLHEMREHTMQRMVRKFPTAPKKYTKELLTHWEFDVFRFAEQDLLPMVVDIFNHFDLLRTFNIPIENLQFFIMEVSGMYHKTNRYHNFVHAFDVLHGVFAFLTEMECAHFFTPIDMLAIFFAAICHDLDHPGYNNAFQINSQSDLAMRYNDVSVLENHHATCAFQLAQRTKLFSALTTEQFKEMRKLAVQLILATDMSNHFEYVSKFQGHLDSQPFDAAKKEDRTLIACFLLKCADVSNAAKPWKLSYEWSTRVSDEFFTQSDFERSNGYPVAPFMDKTKTSPPRITADFMDYVATPLFKVLCKFLKNKKLEDLLAINRKMCGDLLEVQAAATAVAASATQSSTASTTPATPAAPASLKSTSSSALAPSFVQTQPSRKSFPPTHTSAISASRIIVDKKDRDKEKEVILPSSTLTLTVSASHNEQ